jgi:hypothetical protein
MYSAIDQHASRQWTRLDRADVGLFALLVVAVLIGIGVYARDAINGPSAEARAKMACYRLFAEASTRDANSVALDPAAVHKAAQVAAFCAFVGNTVGGPSSYARVPGIEDYYAR